jgi:hypothetical protein
MRRIVFILLSLSSLTLLGQSKMEVCEWGKREAQNKLEKGQIYFPRYIFHSSVTLRKMLEMDYGIIDESYSDSDILYQPQDDCFDSVMIKAISDKWGADFLNKQRQLADKLEKEGKGYVTPSNPTAEKGIDQLMRQGYKDNGIRYKRFRITVVISTTGKIVKHEIHALSEGEVTAKEIEIIDEAISKYSDNWTPGGIKGNPLEMGAWFDIGKYVTGPR